MSPNEFKCIKMYQNQNELKWIKMSQDKPQWVNMSQDKLKCNNVWHFHSRQYQNVQMLENPYLPYESKLFFMSQNEVKYVLPSDTFIVVSIKMCKCSRTHISSTIRGLQSVTACNTHIPENNSACSFFLSLYFESTWKKVNKE